MPRVHPLMISARGGKANASFWEIAVFPFARVGKEEVSWPGEMESQKTGAVWGCGDGGFASLAARLSGKRQAAQRLSEEKNQLTCAQGAENGDFKLKNS